MPYKINKQLGSKIKRVRELHKLTQEELAAKIDVQTATISNIERGVTNTSVYVVYKIAHVLKVHIKELFTFR